jgi:regulator of replication initiation timing
MKMSMERLDQVKGLKVLSDSYKREMEYLKAQLVDLKDLNAKLTVENEGHREISQSYRREAQDLKIKIMNLNEVAA